MLIFFPKLSMVFIDFISIDTTIDIIVYNTIIVLIFILFLSFDLLFMHILQPHQFNFFIYFQLHFKL